jgi:Domain of unknown function (DUF4405)
MNLRKIATPLTIGGFILMSITGVLMFFHKEIGLNKEAHEWFSWAFLVGAGLHVYLNFGTFKKYFTLKNGLPIILLLVAITATSFFLKEEKEGKGGSPIGMVMQSVETAPIATLAILAKTDTNTIIQKLNAEGLKAQNETDTLGQLAGENREAKMHALKAIFGGTQESGKKPD